MGDIGSYLKEYKKTGDRKWFSMIYRMTMSRIYRYFYFKTMQRELSQDLTSEVFIRVYRNLAKTDLNEKSFMVWIYRIAHNILVDYYRKNSGDEMAVGEVADHLIIRDEQVLMQESSFLKKELGFKRPDIISALNSLTGLQKDVIILRFIENMDYRTIAGIFKKSSGTIRGIVFRAMERMRKEIGASDG